MIVLAYIFAKLKCFETIEQGNTSKERSEMVWNSIAVFDQNHEKILIQL